MQSFKWVLLGASALLYSAAFIWSAYLWWLVFVAWVPLFYCAATEYLSFKEGFFWGSLIILGNMWGTFYSLFLMATGAFLLKLLPGFVITLYLGFYGALWFWLNNRLISFFSVEYSKIGRLSIWLITAWGFVWWMDRGSLWIFNTFEGYHLMHPLVPLTEQIQFLGLLPKIGIVPLSFLWLLTNCLLALLLLYPLHWYSMVLLGLAAAPWVVSRLYAPSFEKIPSWVDQVAVVPSWIYEPFDLSKVGKFIEEKLELLVKQKPTIKVAILPESSLPKCNLQTAKEIAFSWGMQRFGHQLTVVIGAARWEKEHCYNSAYLLCNGSISDVYDKRHRMILTEGLAPWWRNPLVATLYKVTEEPIALSQKQHPVWCLTEGVTCVPYICSELFFNPYPDDPFFDEMLLVVCNDTWCEVEYVQRLMYLIARLKALQWERDILYAGYEYAHFCSKSGSLGPSLSHKV